jgi:hypothetical protein
MAAKGWLELESDPGMFLLDLHRDLCHLGKTFMFE